MRSKISPILIIISIFLLVFLSLEGIKIGKFELLSISALIDKNDALDKKIDEVATLTSINYPDNIKTLDETFEQYKIKKQTYEQLAGVTNSNNKEIYETKQYDISYLWDVLGKYAEKRALELGVDVVKEKNKEDIYTFNFTLTGQYTKIIQFITDIENDSELYFRIYNFSMVQSQEQRTKGLIIAKFTVKNIAIDPSTIS